MVDESHAARAVLTRDAPVTSDKLLGLAEKMSTAAYCPYSRFSVGAAVTDGERVWGGCNVENASYGLTICAERSATFSAVSDGAQKLRQIAIWTPTLHPTAPCGSCRQVLAEFGIETVHAGCATGEVKSWSMTDLLPDSFRLDKGDFKSRWFAIDIDNVLADTDDLIRSLIFDTTNGRVEFQYEDIRQFAYTECADRNGNSPTRDEWLAAHSAFARPENIRKLLPKQGAVDAVSSISSVVGVAYVTARNPSARKATADWLSLHGFPGGQLLFVSPGQKPSVARDALGAVDDNLGEVEAYAASGLELPVIFDHPWNRDEGERLDSRIRRVRYWEELHQLILEVVSKSQ